MTELILPRLYTGGVRLSSDLACCAVTEGIAMQSVQIFVLFQLLGDPNLISTEEKKKGSDAWNGTDEVQ
jgi:hypothetical protein